jgi:hypothetical protein
LKDIHSVLSRLMVAKKTLFSLALLRLRQEFEEEARIAWCGSCGVVCGRVVAVPHRRPLYWISCQPGGEVGPPAETDQLGLYLPVVLG